MCSRRLLRSRATLVGALVGALVVLAPLALMAIAFETVLSGERESKRERALSIMRGRIDVERFMNAVERALRDPPLPPARLTLKYEIFVGRVGDIGYLLRQDADAQAAGLQQDVDRLNALIAELDPIMTADGVSARARAQAVYPRVQEAFALFTRLEGEALRASSAAHVRQLERIQDAVTMALFSALVALLTLLALWQVSRRGAQALRAQIEHRQQFLAHLSHEFRTPLNAIQGFAELMSYDFDALSDAKKLEYLDDIRASAAALDELTRSALDLSRIDAGRMDVSPQAEEAAKLASGAARLLSHQAAHKGVALTLDVDPALRVMVDPALMTRAATNLMSNAIKYSKRGGVVAVSFRDGRLTVRDHGCGIPEAEQGLVWEIYRRSSLTRGDGQGFGLGLPLVRAVAQLHGGTVELTSAVGVGTRVSLVLPPDRWWRAPEDAATSTPSAPPAADPAPALDSAPDPDPAADAQPADAPADVPADVPADSPAASRNAA